MPICAETSRLCWGTACPIPRPPNTHSCGLADTPPQPHLPGTEHDDRKPRSSCPSSGEPKPDSCYSTRRHARAWLVPGASSGHRGRAEEAYSSRSCATAEEGTRTHWGASCAEPRGRLHCGRVPVRRTARRKVLEIGGNTWRKFKGSLFRCVSFQSPLLTSPRH